MPKLTIGLPVYNGEKYLARALDSALAQSFTDFQIIIVDNASTDRTEEIVRHYAASDKRITYLRNPINMYFYSWERLVASADSEYFVFLHCDLIWEPTYLEECLAKLEADSEAVLAYSHFNWLGDGGQVVETGKDPANFAAPDPSERYLNILSTLGWCTAFHGIIRHQALIEGFIKINLTVAAADNELLAILALKGKFIQIEKPLLARFKNDHQKGKSETIEAYYLRRYREPTKPVIPYGPKKYLPFLNFIREHCFVLLFADLPPQEINRLIKETGSILLKRYQKMIHYEVKRLIDLIVAGEYKKGWREDKDQPPIALIPGGEFRYLDLSYLLYALQDLEYAATFLPKFPQLNFARALAFLQLGRQKEAILALEKELEQFPHEHKALELKAHLTASTKES